MRKGEKTEFAQLLEKSGLNKKEVADRTGYHIRTVYRWVNGEIIPRKAVIDKLLKEIETGSQPYSLKKTGFTFIDLFAGIGGLRKGFETIGGKCIFTSEWDLACQKTYQANFPFDHPVNGDITDISEEDIPAHDVLVAGFPCQP